MVKMETSIIITLSTKSKSIFGEVDSIIRFILLLCGNKIGERRPILSEVITLLLHPQPIYSLLYFLTHFYLTRLNLLLQQSLLGNVLPIPPFFFLTFNQDASRDYTFYSPLMLPQVLTRPSGSRPIAEANNAHHDKLIFPSIPFRIRF